MAEEIVRLVDACHGHALVLFTSYRQMAEVRALTDGQWQYPTYQAWRNGGKIIQKFKQSGNGVLFAAGSCWEGIDFPGDMVSLLIIAKLPFPIPDPVSDYERKQYPNLHDYAQGYIEDTQYIERKTLIEQQLDEKRVQLSRTSISRNVELTLKSTRKIEKILASDPPLTYFDEHTFTEMVKKVSVSNTAIEFELINGMKLSEERTEK